MTKALLPASLLFVAVASYAADVSPKTEGAGLSGKWLSEFDTRVGHLKYVYVLKADGEKVTGTAFREREGVKTEIELKEGAIHGDKVSFVEPIKIQGQDMRIEYQGTLAGDQMKLTRKVGDFASTEIVARREAQPAAQVDGKWNAEFDTQVGKQKYSYELKTDGAKLTGKAIGESQFGKFDTPITEGKVEGDTVSFVEMLKLPDREIKIDYTGKLAGDELKLTRKVGDFATEEFAAKRVPASAK